MKNSDENRKKWAKLIAKAWSDRDFCKRLEKNPQAVCKEFGIELPANTTYEVDVETQNKRHLVIPVKPDLELSEEDLLKSVKAGDCMGCATGTAPFSVH